MNPLALIALEALITLLALIALIESCGMARFLPDVVGPLPSRGTEHVDTHIEVQVPSIGMHGRHHAGLRRVRSSMCSDGANRCQGGGSGDNRRELPAFVDVRTGARATPMEPNTPSAGHEERAVINGCRNRDQVISSRHSLRVCIGIPLEKRRAAAYAKKTFVCPTLELRTALVAAI